MDAELFGARERLVARALMLGGVVALAAGAALGEGHRLPMPLLLAWVAAFVVAKVVLALQGRSVGWPAWKALLAEGGAFALVGWVVWSGSRLATGGASAVAPLVGCAALLGLAGLLRRRGSDA